MGKLYVIAYRHPSFMRLFGEEEKKGNIIVIENGLAAPKNLFLQITRFLFDWVNVICQSGFSKFGSSVPFCCS